MFTVWEMNAFVRSAFSAALLTVFMALGSLTGRVDHD